VASLFRPAIARWPCSSRSHSLDWPWPLLLLLVVVALASLVMFGDRAPPRLLVSAWPDRASGRIPGLDRKWPLVHSSKSEAFGRVGQQSTATATAGRPAGRHGGSETIPLVRRPPLKDHFIFIQSLALVVVVVGRLARSPLVRLGRARARTAKDATATQADDRGSQFVGDNLGWSHPVLAVELHRSSDDHRNHQPAPGRAALA
jgi:hypothetical protein